MSTDRTLGPGPDGKWALAEGAVLGGYRVIRPVGRGGMGEVYLVEHTGMGKRYAMKLLSAAHSRDPSFRDRFRVEARLMADLEHPGIVRVHNMGEEGGRYFLVMDYVEAASGEPVTLDDLVRKRKLGESESRSLAIGIARALDYAHSFGEAEGQAPSKVRPALAGVGVVHRDLKPANVLLGADGRVKVSDFGLAKVMGEAYIKSVLDKSVRLSMSAAPTVARDGGAGSPGITQSDGAVLGTFEFMAPEQKEGRADARSDIYSLGLIIYRMLTGKRAEGRFPDPSKLGLSGWWDGVIEKTLAPDPDDRYLSAKELLADLEGAQVRSPSRRAVAGARLPLGQRALIVLAGAAVAVVVAIAFYILFTLQPVDPPPPPPPINTTDLAPQVRLARAPEGSLADPSATLELEIEATDDKGLGEVGLVHVVRGKATRVVLSRPRRGERRSNVHYRFRLAPLGLREGETVTYYAYAIDDDAGGPKEGQSRARRVKVGSPRAGDEAAWLAAKREAEVRAARGDYDGALGIIKRFLDSAKTVRFKPQAVGLWGEIEQKKIEAERRRRPYRTPLQQRQSGPRQQKGK